MITSSYIYACMRMQNCAYACWPRPRDRLQISRLAQLAIAKGLAIAQAQALHAQLIYIALRACIYICMHAKCISWPGSVRTVARARAVALAIASSRSSSSRYFNLYNIYIRTYVYVYTYVHTFLDLQFRILSIQALELIYISIIHPLNINGVYSSINCNKR